MRRSSSTCATLASRSMERSSSPIASGSTDERWTNIEEVGSRGRLRSRYGARGAAHRWPIIRAAAGGGDSRLYGFDGETRGIVCDGGLAADMMTAVWGWASPVIAKGRPLSGWAREDLRVHVPLRSGGLTCSRFCDGWTVRGMLRANLRKIIYMRYVSTLALQLTGARAAPWPSVRVQNGGGGGARLVVEARLRVRASPPGAGLARDLLASS
jgi:hypothetical protein